jgi:methylenetetrahydrofolate--tRNA-(uracil-5-)-methyltransferase
VDTSGTQVTIIGAGLAGCEAAYQLAARGIRVVLIEGKRKQRTPAQSMDGFCELVCSNSLRGAALVNAIGLLKHELREAGSLILAAAEFAKVPAGGALAVDREIFSRIIEEYLAAHPLVTIRHEVVEKIPEATPERPVILATGPLTGDALAADLERITGGRIAYYDAIAPIVAADSIDWSKVFRQSRWGKGGEANAETGELQDADSLGDEAYVNCPMDRELYEAFVAELAGARRLEEKPFEKIRYFEGCLPVEVMAERGVQTLSFGPMKPVGLTDPRTGRRPYAVVQLRQEDAGATAYNLVGFQSRMPHPEQARIFKMIPGLEEAEFMRFGTIHRNTFVHSPTVLDEDMQLRGLPNVYLAGQVTGVEGYVESAAGGFGCAVHLARKLLGEPRTMPPATTALGGLLRHLQRATDDYQPSNVTWAMMPPHPNRKLKKRDRYAALSEVALADAAAWRAALGPVPAPVFPAR